MIIFYESFSHDPSIHPFVPSSIHEWHHTGKKTLAKINKPPSPLPMCCYLEKACQAQGGGDPQDFDINISNKPNKIFSSQGPHEYMQNVVYKEVFEI